jgi:hypothetical protein
LCLQRTDKKEKECYFSNDHARWYFPPALQSVNSSRSGLENLDPQKKQPPGKIPGGRQEEKAKMMKNLIQEKYSLLKVGSNRDWIGYKSCKKIIFS